MNARMKQIMGSLRCGHSGKVKTIQEEVNFGDGTGLKVGDYVMILGVSFINGAAVVPIGTEEICYVRPSAVAW